MAAYIEGKAATTLDQTGLAQKGGAVFSHIRIAEHEGQLHTVRISDANADTLIACDLVAAGNKDATLAKLNPAKSHSVINSDIAPTSAFVMTQTVTDEKKQMLDQIGNCSNKLDCINGTSLTQKALGATTTSNLFMVGYAYQKGLIPLSFSAILQAIELNGVAVKENHKTVIAGRMAASNLSQLNEILGVNQIKVEPPQTLSDKINVRKKLLTQYQNESYADRYQQRVEQLKSLEEKIKPGSTRLAEAVANSYYKLLAYKDEYEVARLHTEDEFTNKLANIFEGDYRVNYHLAPPLLASVDTETGRAKKRRFGPWVTPLLKFVAGMKGLRNTALDPFQFAQDRRDERELLERYESSLQLIQNHLSENNYAMACELADIPEQIRGYGVVKKNALLKIDKRWLLLTQLFAQPEDQTNSIEPIELVAESI